MAEHLTTEENLVAGAHIQSDRKLVATGWIKPHESVVLFNTGGALKYLDVIN